MKIRNYTFLIILLSFASFIHAQEEVKFHVDAPLTVVAGTNFKVSYILENANGNEFQLKGDFEGLDLYYGPSISQSSSVSIINGKRSASSSTSYTYLLEAKKEGMYTIPESSILVDGKIYKTKEVKIKALPPDKNTSSNNQGNQRHNPQTGSTIKSTPNNISKDELFVRIDFSKQKVMEQEAVVATFKLYSTLDIISLTDATFPEFQGFMSEDFELPVNRQFKLENYNGKNYYTIDIKKTLLFPQQSGKLTIPSGSITLIVSVPSGKYIPDFFGVRELKEKVEKTLRTSPMTIDVSKLPENKPDGFSNGVGDFNIKASVTNNKVVANSSTTLNIEISGTGNLKLLKNPKVEFPKEFETFDPKIDNKIQTTVNGQTGKRNIEYVIIPRYPGAYTIPPISFSYYDLASKSYKILHTDSIKIEVAKDPNIALNTQAIAQKNNEVTNDIRYLETDKPKFKNYLQLSWGNKESAMWYILPTLLLLISFILYRKQIRANADVVGTKMKKANRMAIKRLKLANKYLKENNKDLFYEESLRAMWGYLSDKLIIPVADLNRENIENVLNKESVQKELINEIIDILDTCEFERYAPVRAEQAMDNLYEKMITLIGNLENVLKIKR